MRKYNLNKYLDDTEIKFYNPQILITILEDYLGKDFESIKCDVDSALVTVTTEEICTFLDKKFEEEDPEAKLRIEERKKEESLKQKSQEKIFNSWKSLPLSDEEIKESSQKFMDELTEARYYFEPYTLEYFKRYSNIVKSKAHQLLHIIEKLANKDLVSIEEIITELDIQLNEKQDISREDIIRLISPMLHNYTALQEKINTANNLETYLTFKMPKHSIYKEGCSENEIYPNKTIFTNNLYYNDLPGNIPLSSRQKESLNNQQSANIKIIAKILIDQ